MAALTPGDIAAAASLYLQVSIAEVRAAMNTPTNPRELRDEFAIAALQSPQLVREGQMLDYDAAARAAYRLADAMLEARNANR